MNATTDQPTRSSIAPAQTMRAVVQSTYGTTPDTVLRVVDVERPMNDDDDIIVHVAAAGVDRGTWHIMSGLPYAMRLAGFGLRAPKSPNPGRSLAGTVTGVGKNVIGFVPGDEVCGTAAGSFAHYVRVEPDKLAHKPSNLSFEQAAALPISATTALQAIRDKANVEPGESVLIVGASGGVGGYAVQIAKAFGAEVTGVCSTSKTDLVWALGADHVVDYTTSDFADGDRHYDAIIDIGGSRRVSDLRRALTRRGRLVIVGGETDGRWLGGFDRTLRAVLRSPFVRHTLKMLTSSENAADLRSVRDLAEAGKVTPIIDRSFPLNDAASAIQYLHDGHVRGKIVITM